MGKLLLNGKLVDEKRAVVSTLDRGLLYGDGLFETMRAYGGRVFRLGEHLARLARSAKALRIPFALDPGAVEKLLRVNRLADAYVRITLTRGLHAGGIRLDAGARPTLVIHAREYPGYPKTLYKTGMKVAFADAVRATRSVVGRHKTLNYLENLLARDAASRAKCYEALFLDEKGFVAECAASNIFFVRKGVLCTPSAAMNILPGITRGVVLSLARAAGIRVREGRWRLRDVQRADEAFLTNSLMEVMPVRQVAGKRIALGGVTRRLAAGYRNLVERECI